VLRETFFFRATAAQIEALFFRCGDFLRRAFVPGPIANQFLDDRHVLHTRRPNVEIFRRLHSGADCP
jgi:hypothetical protein